MFLTEKYSSSHGHGHGHDRHSKKLHNYSLEAFEEALIFRLNSLPPLPPSSPSVPLSWLASVVRLLYATLSSFASLLSDSSLSLSLSLSDLSSHLNCSSASLLDASNSISAAVDRLTSLRLHLRRGSVTVWDPKPASSPLASLSLPPTPRGKSVASVRRAVYAVYAVEAVSALVVGSVLAGIGHAAAASSLSRILVPVELPWADAFKAVAFAVQGRTGAEEIAAVTAAVEKLKAAADGNDGVEEAVLATEVMAEGLEALGSAVDGLFQAGLCSRNMAMDRFRAGLRPS